MNNLAIAMSTMNVPNDGAPVEIHTIGDRFRVERTKTTNEDQVVVFRDELFVDGKFVSRTHSMDAKPEEIVAEYLQEQQENTERKEKQKTYRESSNASKNNRWKVYAQRVACDGERLGGSSVIRIAELRTEEPEINLFIDEMVMAVATLFDLPYEEVLRDHFAIDESGKDFVRNSRIE